MTFLKQERLPRSGSLLKLNKFRLKFEGKLSHEYCTQLAKL